MTRDTAVSREYVLENDAIQSGSRASRRRAKQVVIPNGAGSRNSCTCLVDANEDRRAHTGASRRCLAPAPPRQMLFCQRRCLHAFASG